MRTQEGDCGDLGTGQLAQAGSVSGPPNLIDYSECNKVLSFGVSNTYLPKLEDIVHFICIWDLSREIRIINKLFSICAEVEGHPLELNLDRRRETPPPLGFVYFLFMMFVCMRVCTMLVSGVYRGKKTIISPVTSIIDGCEPLHGA